MSTIYLEPSQVPVHLRGAYTGQKFKAEVTTKVSIPPTAGLWSGGSRDEYALIRLADGRSLDAAPHDAAPWSEMRKRREYELQPGFAVKRHTIFEGRDLGLTFYVHPSDAAAMLPAPVDLTDIEWNVLDIIGSFKSAYREEERGRRGLRVADYDAAKNRLILRGFLTKIGAITPAGRNARSAGKPKANAQTA